MMMNFASPSINVILIVTNERTIIIIVFIHESIQISVGNLCNRNGPDQFSDGLESVPICRH